MRKTFGDKKMYMLKGSEFSDVWDVALYHSKESAERDAQFLNHQAMLLEEKVHSLLDFADRDPQKVVLDLKQALKSSDFSLDPYILREIQYDINSEIQEDCCLELVLGYWQRDIRYYVFEVEVRK